MIGFPVCPECGGKSKVCAHDEPGCAPIMHQYIPCPSCVVITDELRKVIGLEPEEDE